LSENEQIRQFIYEPWFGWVFGLWLWSGLVCLYFLVLA